MLIHAIDAPEVTVGRTSLARDIRRAGFLRALEKAGHDVSCTTFTPEMLSSGMNSPVLVGDCDVVHVLSTSAIPLAPRGVPMVLSPRVSVSRLAGQSVVHVERGASGQLASSPVPIRTMILPSVESGTAWPSELSSVPIVTVPTGVDTDLFCPEGPRSPTQDQVLRLLVVGSPGTAHGFLDVLRAIRHLPRTEHHPTVEVVFTAGPDVDLSATQDARDTYAMACALGLADRVSFARPFSSNLTAKVLRSTDIVATIGADDVDHHIVLQAMAVGRPVIATNVGCNLDIVVDQVTGVLVPHGNEVALTKALRGLVDDSFFRESLGLCGRDRAVSRYDWARVSAELIRVYRRSIVAASPMREEHPTSALTPRS